MKKVIILYSFIFLFLNVNAQISPDTSIYPVVGTHCPNFILRNIRYFSKYEANNWDFKGKWLILDFWNKNCGACVSSFPKINALQQKFSSKAQFMLVGIQDKENVIQPMFAKFRKIEHLLLPCAFDSLLAKHWDIYTSPYIIVIDPFGTVRAITGSLNERDIVDFLSGITPDLTRAYRIHENTNNDYISFDPNKPYLISGNGGSDTDFRFRSLLSDYHLNQRRYQPSNISDSMSMGRFQVIGVPLFILYEFAFWGKRILDTGYLKPYAFQPKLEILDSSVFQWSRGKASHLYCYSLIIPKNLASRKRMQAIMQNDLENYFGFKAQIEERSFPCWKLVASQRAKETLATKGGNPTMIQIIPKVEFKLTNWPFRDFFENEIEGGMVDTIIDETGITGNIDIHFKCVMMNFNDVRRELHAHGLELIPSTILKKVIVIKDENQN